MATKEEAFEFEVVRVDMRCQAMRAWTCPKPQAVGDGSHAFTAFESHQSPFNPRAHSPPARHVAVGELQSPSAVEMNASDLGRCSNFKLSWSLNAIKQLRECDGSRVGDIVWNVASLFMHQEKAGLGRLEFKCGARRAVRFDFIVQQTKGPQVDITSSADRVSTLRRALHANFPTQKTGFVDLTMNVEFVLVLSGSAEEGGVLEVWPGDFPTAPRDLGPGRTLARTETETRIKAKKDEGEGAVEHASPC